MYGQTTRPAGRRLCGVARRDEEPFAVAGVLQIGEVVDERLLGGAQLPPLGRRPVGGQAEAPRRGGAGPAAGDPVHGGRHAVGLGHDLAEGGVVRRPAGVEGGDRPDGGRVEGAEAPPLLRRRQALGERQQGRRRLEPVDHEEQVGATPDLAGDGRCGRGEGLGGGVEVVDHGERRRPGGRRAENVVPAAAAPGDVPHQRAGLVGRRGQLGGETRLADARCPGHHDDAAPAVTRPAPVPAQPAQLPIATDDRDDRVELGRQRRSGTRGGRGRGRLTGDRGAVAARCRGVAARRRGVAARRMHAHDRDTLVQALELRALGRAEREPGHRAGEVDQALRGEHLARPGGRAEARGLVQRRPAKPFPVWDGLAGVEPDPDAERQCRIGGGLVRERGLQLDGGAEGPAGRVEDGQRLVAAQLDELAAPRLDSLGDDLGEPARQSGGRVVAVERREARVAADVSDEERPHRGCPRASLVDSGHASPPSSQAEPPHGRSRCGIGDTLAVVSRGAAQ